MILLIPTISLIGRYRDISSLLSVLRPAWNYTGHVELNFESCNFLTAEAVSLLAGLVHVRQEHGFEISVQSTFAPRVKSNLIKIILLS